ncbi:MAG: MBL fold metallo-hydrolase [Phycisphaerae bacterium]|nr:MBL fold metallo-hydrolase [Phycisphaerae bacterium]
MNVSATIQMLGTASGLPCLEGFQTSCLLDMDGDAYLFDAGEPCAATLYRREMDFNTIRAVFISHMHADHFSGVPMLVQTMQLLGRTSPLKLFVPPEAVLAVTNLLAAQYLMNELLPYELEVLPIEAGKRFFADKSIEVKALANPHLAVFKEKIGQKYPNRMESFSFLITLGSRKTKILYSGDIRNIDNLDPFLAEGIVDVLVLECAHIKPEETLQYLDRNAEVREVILTHFGPSWAGRKTELANMEYSSGKVRVAADGLCVALS